MISGRAKYYLMQAAEEEQDAAIGAHGLFHSDHEAWAVMKEEVQELLELFDEDKILVNLDNVWGKIRRDETIDAGDMTEIYNWAMSCAKEAVQVMAMCMKWGKSYEQRKQEEG